MKFQASYALILRAHMDALKKREKTKPGKGNTGAKAGGKGGRSKGSGGKS